MAMSEDFRKKGEEQEEEAQELYYAAFYGFERLEREHRADGWFHGRASHYARCKKDLIRQRPRNCLANQMSTCYFGAPIRTVSTLKDSAVIIHGPSGCAGGMYIELALFKPKEELLTTGMGEGDAILGGEAKLRRAIERAIERFRPGVVAVVATCTPSIIGDDIVGISEEMEARSGIPILPFNAPGFKHRNWNMGWDESFNRIIDRMEPAVEVVSGSINFLNVPALALHYKEFYEILPDLRRIGVKINTHTPFSMTFQELLERFPRAQLNVSRCHSTTLQSAEYAEKRLGTPYLRVPKPVSLRYTEEFLRAIAAFFGRQPEAEAHIDTEKERIRGRLERVRSRLAGKRISLCAGPGKTIALAQLATELGMEVVFLSPVKCDSLFHELLDGWLERTGLDPEILAEESYYEQEAILSRLKPDVHVGIFEEHLIANRLGIPFVDMLAISYPQLCGFEGAVLVGEHLAALLDNPRIRRWAPSHQWSQIQTIYSSQRFLQTSLLARGIEN